MSSRAANWARTFPHDMSWIMHRYSQAKAAFMASGLDLVPCFNDPMPGNFLIGAEAGAAPKAMRLIDYEFASNNERSYELGVLFAEMFFDEHLTEGLIEQYLGAVRPEMVARVIVNRALADIKWASWAVVNRKLKDWDFRLSEIRGVEVHAGARRDVRSPLGNLAADDLISSSAATVPAIA